jgi:hypothetical protein
VVYYCFGCAGITGSASARTLILIIIIIIIIIIKTKICIINQDCVPFEYHENEYIHNVIGVAKRYFLNLDLKTEMLGDCFISLGIKL